MSTSAVRRFMQPGSMQWSVQSGTIKYIRKLLKRKCVDINSGNCTSGHLPVSIGDGVHALRAHRLEAFFLLFLHLVVLVMRSEHFVPGRVESQSGISYRQQLDRAPEGRQFVHVPNLKELIVCDINEKLILTSLKSLT